MLIRKIFLIFLLFVSISAVKKNYNGYKVYKVVPKVTEDIFVLTEMWTNKVIDVWEEGFGLNFDAKVMVPAENLVFFLETVKSHAIETLEVISDLQKLIDNQLKPAVLSRNVETYSFLSMTWDRYYNLTVINNWLDEVVTTYPDVVQSVVMGTSNEGREIRGIIIDFNKEKEDKLIGMIEGTLHAREWITTAVVTWIIKEFLTSTDPEVRSFAENFEWHIFPVVNPDGYEYTFSSNRMWRKNRNPLYNTACSEVVDDSSNGVDLNRNFDHQWMVIGASADPCTNTYAGPSPFSEPESRAIAQYVQNLKGQGELMYYLSFHSYSQLVVIPYSHVNSTDEIVGIINYADMYEVAITAADRLKDKHGMEYRVGIGAEVLYPFSGSSFDWVKEQADAQFSYLIELRDRGEFGFLLPAEQIIPNSEEMMEFLVEMDNTAKKLGYYSGTTHFVVSVTVMLFGVILSAFVM